MLSITGTFSKAPQAFGWNDRIIVGAALGPAKVVIQDRESGHTNAVTDWISGLGAILLGYRDEQFIYAVESGVRVGAGFSLATYLEHTVAEKLASLLSANVPYWNDKQLSVRFGSTGSDACSMAVRLARAVTGKDVIVSYGYHGWGAEFISAEPPGWGIPAGYKRDLVRKIKWNNKDSVEMAFARGNIACIIIEQPPQATDLDWYSFLREVCNHYGSLFIMDEVVTGLRYGLGGASQVYGVEPDLICMGKGLGNGIPISAVVGFKEHMDWFTRTDPVFCSSTHWGNTVGLSAANHILDVWDGEHLNYIHNIGGQIISGLELAGWKGFGTPVRSLLKFESDLQRAFFINEMFKRGHLLNRPNFPHMGHTEEDVSSMFNAAADVNIEWSISDKNKLAHEYEDKLPRVLFKNR